jgi:hypothetical protein
MIARILAIVSIPFSIFYGVELMELLISFDFSKITQLYFIIALAASGMFTLIFIRSDSYIAIFEHELVHNLIAVLTFRKPVGFNVRSGAGGQFEYYGRSNILIRLGPYFFPTIPAILFPLYWIVDEKFVNLFFILIGAGLGFQIVTNLKESHVHQTDLKQHGLLFSYLLVLCFNIIILGILFAFFQNEFGGINSFLSVGFKNTIDQVVSRVGLLF